MAQWTTQTLFPFCHWYFRGWKSRLYFKHLVAFYIKEVIYFSYCSVAESCSTICSPKDCSMPGLPLLHCLPEFAQIHVHWVGDVIQSSHPQRPLSPFTFNLSQHQSLVQWVDSLHQVAKLLDLQFQHQSFQWKSGLISLGIAWIDLLAVQKTLKSLLQHHNSKTSIFQCSAFFMV